MTRHAIGEASGSAAGTRPRRLLAAARLARALGLAVLAIVAFGYAVLPSLAVWWIPPIAVSFGLVGALIGARRPENPVGWLFLGWAVVAAVDFAAYHYAERALTTDHGSLPAADVAASIAPAHVSVWLRKAPR